MRRYATTTAALATLLFACGKSEPAPQPAVGTTEAPKPAEPTKNEAGTDDHPKKDPSVAEDKAQIGGTSDRSAAPTTPTTPTTPPSTPLPVLAGGGAPPQVGALSPSSIAAFPADIVAVGGTPSLQGLVQAFVTQAKNMPGLEVPPDPLPMAIQALQAKVGVNLAWLDTDKPLRFAVPDPKKYPDGFVVLMPEKAGAGLEAAMIPDAKPGEGHFLVAKIGDRQVFFNRAVAGHVLVTSHPDLAKNLEAFAKDLAAWTPKDPLVLDTSVENLVRIFAEELKNAKEMVGTMGSAMAQDPEMAAKMGPMMQMASSGFALVEGTSRISLSLDPVGDFPRVGLSFRGLPGSPLEKIAKDLADRKIKFAGAVPADAWFAMGFNIEGMSYLSNAQGLVDSLTRPTTLGPIQVTWSDDEKQAMLAIIKRSQEIQGTQSMTWLRQEGARPFILESLGDSKDGKAMAQVMIDLGDLFYKKVWGEGRKAMLAQGMKDGDVPAEMSFKDFLGLMSKNTAAMGFSAAVNDATTKAGNKVNALEISLDWSRLPLRGQAKMVGDLIGDRVGIAIAGEGEHFSAVVGPDAAQRATRILDSAASLPDQVDPWLAKAADQAIFLMLRPARLMRALVDVVPGLAGARSLIGALADDPIVVQGKSDGSSLYLEGILPLKIIIALATMR